MPPRGLFPVCCYHNHHLYVFGGQHGYPDEDEDFVEGNNNLLYKLNLITLEWTLINVSNPPLPREKGLMVGFGQYLYLYGGYGDPPDDFDYIKPKSNLDPESSYQWPRAWLGSLHRFDLKLKCWELFLEGPIARCGHAGKRYTKVEK